MADGFFLDDKAVDDPTADFLAREQAVLGEDAALFGNPGSFQQQSPPINSFQQQSPTGASSANNTNAVDYTAFEAPHEPVDAVVPEVESEPIRKWKQEFQSAIDSRNAKAKTNHEQTLKEAKEALERFYAEYNEKKAKSVAKNKEHEKQLIATRDDLTTGTVWERAYKQIEQAAAAAKEKKIDDKKSKNPDKTSARDTTRLKQLMASLKNDKKAPGIV